MQFPPHDNDLIPYLTTAEAVDFRAQRERLLASLEGRVETSFKKSKLHTGPISRGCQLCGEGAWSCLFLNGLFVLFSSTFSFVNFCFRCI